MVGCDDSLLILQNSIPVTVYPFMNTLKIFTWQTCPKIVSLSFQFDSKVIVCFSHCNCILVGAALHVDTCILKSYSLLNQNVSFFFPAAPPAQYHPAYVQQGYYPMQAVPGPQTGMTYSPFPGRESYSQGSAYSSQPPPSYHRSYTPTSSRSGRSKGSKGSNDSSVKYIHDKEKVALPVNVWQQREGGSGRKRGKGKMKTKRSCVSDTGSYRSGRSKSSGVCDVSSVRSGRSKSSGRHDTSSTRSGRSRSSGYGGGDSNRSSRSKGSALYDASSLKDIKGSSVFDSSSMQGKDLVIQESSSLYEASSLRDFKGSLVFDTNSMPDVASIIYEGNSDDEIIGPVYL